LYIHIYQYPVEKPGAGRIGEAPVAQKDGLIVSEPVAKPLQGGRQRLVRQVAVRVGPEDLAQPLLGDLPPPQGDQAFQQQQRLLPALPGERKGLPVDDQAESAAGE